jgi:selenocysteine-specific elongation factor
VRVVATAGHVDHGKSTLVQALTGIDPDRFEEEKRRGLTIDLGFAWTTLPSGAAIAFVDVPGHVRFLKNMLAGVGAVDACLFVVAATEGWKQQTEEHLRILELLGIGHGVVALTKAALVEDLDARHDHVAERLRGSFLEGAPIVAVDAPAGRGLDELRAALGALVEATPAAADRGRARLWVDRCFAATGSGTVVTGTLTSGPLTVGDDVAIVTAKGELRARVRGLQSCGERVVSLPPGSRAAVNLAGVSHRAIVRGDVLMAVDRWHLTATVDASLTVLPTLDHDVSRRGAYLAYIGSGEHDVSVRIVGPDVLSPGETGSVRLHLPLVLPLMPGDRYVLRESGRAETVGGGEVLDVAPVLRVSRAQPDRSVARVVAERGWVDVDELERLTGVRRDPTVDRWVVDAQMFAATVERLRGAVGDAGPLGLDVATLDERDRAALGSVEGVTVEQGRARLARAQERHPYVELLEADPFSPPSPDEAGVDRAAARQLVQRGLVVEHDGRWFAPSAVDAAIQVVAGLLAAQPDGITVGQVTKALGTSRKWAVPLLSLLDSRGVTRRRGDLRIAGPRLP